MTNKDKIRVVLFIAICILMNFGGKAFAEAYSLPVWFDSFGTALTAFCFGPVCGAIVGFAGNIIFGLTFGRSYMYAVTSIVIGIVIGLTAKKRSFDTLFGTMMACTLVTLSSIAVSVPINVIFCNGKTGNTWGDGVIGFLSEHNVPVLLSEIAGEFYVDFLDKVITLLMLFGLIKLRSWIVKRAEHIKKHPPSTKGAGKISAVIICAAVTVSALGIRTSADAGSEDLSGYVRTVYSSDNGLPCGEANDIVQTKDGILWIGTYAGLYRYNGSEFRWMNEYDSVRNVNCLYVDEEGRLWIGTNDNGVTICINERVSSVIDKESGLPSDSIRCITKSADGNYYIGTTESMAVLSLNSGLELLNVIPQVHYAVTVAADKSGKAAAVNAEGRLFLLGNGEILTTLDDAVKDELFSCCEFGNDGMLYVGSSLGTVYIYKTEGSGLVREGMICCGKLSSIQSLDFDEEGRCFVCADNGVGYIDTTGKYSDINTEEFNNSIDNMTIDYQGNLWFTSSRLGVMRLSKSVFTDINRIYGLPGNVVNTVEEWNGRLYIGTDTGLETADIDGKKRVTDNLSEILKGVRIRCIRKDSRNCLWICTYGNGLIKVSPDGSRVIYDSTSGSFGNRARTVLELSDGTIAAAGDTGISFIDENGIKGTITYGDGFSNAMILSLLETDDGAVLAGTDGDGIVVIRNSGPVRTLTRYDGLSSGVILRMTKCTDGENILIVTSNGLCCMDKDFNIRKLENFPYFNNYDIWTSSSGKLFVLGSAGIYVVNEQDVIDDVEDMNYELLDNKSGLNVSLTANSWNYRDENGGLYISADTGVYLIDTATYSSNKRSYRMLMNTVKLDGVTYPVIRGEEFDIARGVNRIELFPEVINYTIDDPNVRFYLEGFDTEPTVVYQSELSSVTYTNLPSGRYVFRVAVLDSERENVLEESTYVLVKEKEIYDNHWFIIYMVLVGIMSVAWFTWFIARTQTQRTLAIQQKHIELAERQIEMGNQTILAIAKTVDAKDENTSQHSQRVSEYSVMIAKELGFDDEECENLRKAALLHDIGKIGIPDSILNKPAKLTDEEYAVMKTHVTRGGEILKDFTIVKNVVDGALYHHERYDGSGYASGLKGEEIPIYGRIIGVADAFDAMTANRVYRKKLDMDYVIGELERCKGKQFDPVIADIMLKLLNDGRIDIESIYGKRQSDDI